jgi:hypothetical protein
MNRAVRGPLRHLACRIFWCLIRGHVVAPRGTSANTRVGECWAVVERGHDETKIYTHTHPFFISHTSPRVNFF